MQELLTSGSLTFLADFVGLAVVVTALLLLDWQLALVTFAIVPPLVLVMVWWAKHAKQAFVNVRIKISALYGTLAENVSGVRAVQASAASRARRAAATFSSCTAALSPKSAWATEVLLNVLVSMMSAPASR